MASGEIDVAFIWGPTASYFAAQQKTPLTILPVTRFDGPQLPMIFDVSMGVQKGDQSLRTEIEDVLARREREVKKLLEGYGLPLVSD